MTHTLECEMFFLLGANTCLRKSHVLHILGIPVLTLWWKRYHDIGRKYPFGSWSLLRRKGADETCFSATSWLSVFPEFRSLCRWKEKMKKVRKFVLVICPWNNFTTLLSSQFVGKLSAGFCFPAFWVGSMRICENRSLFGRIFRNGFIRRRWRNYSGWKAVSRFSFSFCFCLIKHSNNGNQWEGLLRCPTNPGRSDLLVLLPVSHRAVVH